MTTVSQARVAGLASRRLANELNILARSGKWEIAMATLQRIEPSNTVQENVYHYTIVISACGRAGKLAEAFSVFDRMKERQIQPNLCTYTALITACANKGLINDAFRVYAEMRLQKEIPNVKTITAIVTACARVGKWEKAIQVLKEAERLSIETNVITYTAAIEACRRAEVCKPAMALLALMHNSQNLRPNNVTYNTVLGACTAANDTNAVLQVYAKMVADGYGPVAYTRDLLIKHFKGTDTEDLVQALEIQGNARSRMQGSDSAAAMEAAQGSN
ncbi:unnamed protein product [Phytomonas sp. Hart1]|nr:unnamed protein product [Phytomonas sp. Hart1]|eukprot:CCW69906.1 unnamed protein product [Phytomonas sp. isolate Hart1]